MKIQIDIISGFLGSGKTKFINLFLEKKIQSKENIVVIQCEAGETEIEKVHLEAHNVWILDAQAENGLTAEYLYECILKYRPKRILIEYNGMLKLEDLLNLLKLKRLRKYVFMGDVIHTLDTATFELFSQNIGGTFIEQISNSDVIILNQAELLSKEGLSDVVSKLNHINPFAEIVDAADALDLKVSTGDQKQLEKTFNIFFALFAFFIIGYLSFSFLKNMDYNWGAPLYSKILVLNTVFLSILLEAFPFILFGVFISSLVQVLVPKAVIVKLFPRNRALGFVAALGAGVLFPVCDCAVIPVAARLVKKGVPLGTAVTFMLAAPIVNPIVVISTLYAFQGLPIVAFSRIIMGAIVALVVGLIIALTKWDQEVLLDPKDDFYCDCESCLDLEFSTGFIGKTRAVFAHTGTEFITVGRFLIIGALISSMVQVFIPKEIVFSLSDKPAVTLLIMMLAAFVMSICSTSDAFIARTFVNQMSMGSVMGFLVLGPMMDFKNLLVLMGSFKKGFVVRLVLLIGIISFEVLWVATQILF